MLDVESTGQCGRVATEVAKTFSRPKKVRYHYLENQAR